MRKILRDDHDEWPNDRDVDDDAEHQTKALAGLV